MRTLMMLLVISLAACSALAETYFIRESGNNSNNGLTPSTAFASLSHFANIAQPGDTVYIGAGEYTGEVRFRNAGEADEPILIVGDPTGDRTGDAGRVILSHVSSSDMVRLVNADHYEFHNIHFQGGQEGMRIDSSEGIVVQNCTFDDARDRAIGVMNNGSVTVVDSDITARKVGINISNGSAVVTDSVIRDLSQTALFIQNSGSSIEARRVRIERVQRGAQTNNGSLTLINVLIDDTSQEGVLTKNQTTLLMVHCTVNDTTRQGVRFRGSATLYNNIFSNIGSHAMHRERGRVIASHNLIFNKRGYQSAGFNSLEYAFDPMYVDADAGDFSLMSDSRARDLGRDVSSYTDQDISGFERPSGDGFDLGAYEESAPPVFYVRATGSDSRDGLTFNTAFRTIQHAVDQCTRAGSTVYVGPGVYRESIEVGFGDGAGAVSGTEQSPIQIIADIQGVETNEEPGAVVIDGRSSQITGIDIRNVTDWMFQGFTIQGFRQYALRGSGAGVMLRQSVVHVPDRYGVYLLADGDVEISDCRFVRSGDSGHVIWIQPTNRREHTSVLVTRNDASMRGGLYRASGLENGGGASVSLRPRAGSSYGIAVTAASGPLTDELEISNNVLSDCDVGIYSSLRVNDSRRLRIMNNTVTGSYISIQVWNNRSTYWLANNIISSCYYGAFVPYARSSSSPVFSHLEHDITYNMANFGRSFEFDMITENPGFIDPENGDFSLSSRSPAVDAGDSRYAPGVDLRGVSRPSDGNDDGIAVHNIGATESVVDDGRRVRVVHWREIGGAEE